eukprot:jgi/Chrpa1/9163/Chrysochromulina_OHIO_Genome00017632-RA
MELEPLAPYTDPDTGLVIAPLDKGRALDLIDHLPCVVHLLKEFRMKRIQELPQLNLHLSGSTDASGNVVGMLLIKIDHGRRGVITLDCRLLCVASSREAGEKLARWEIARALLIPMASITKATRVVAIVNKNDAEAKKLWADLGFNFVPSDDLHTLNAVLDPIELNITHKTHAAGATSLLLDEHALQGRLPARMVAAPQASFGTICLDMQQASGALVKHVLAPSPVPAPAPSPAPALSPATAAPAPASAAQANEKSIAVYKEMMRLRSTRCLVPSELHGWRLSVSERPKDFSRKD